MAIKAVPIGTKSLQKAILNLSKDVQDKAWGYLEDAAEVAAEFAREEFKTASYDGPEPDIDVSVEHGDNGIMVVARGDEVGYIEYGTGVHRDPSYKNKSTKHSFWFFKASGSVRLSGTGEPAKPRLRKGREHSYYIGPKGGRHAIDLASTMKPIDYSSGTPVYRETVHGEYLRQGKAFEYNKTREYEIHTEPAEESEDSRDGVYWTRGNKPNLIMKRAAERLVKEFNKNYKTLK